MFQEVYNVSSLFKLSSVDDFVLYILDQYVAECKWSEGFLLLSMSRYLRIL